MIETQEATDYELARAFANGPGQAFRFSANPTGSGGSWEHDAGTGFRFENDTLVEAAVLEYLGGCTGVRVNAMRFQSVLRMVRALRLYRGRKA